MERWIVYLCNSGWLSDWLIQKNNLQKKNLVMDANDLFRRLAVGAKFNFKRFEQDAKKLKIQHPPNSDNRDRVHNKTLTLGEILRHAAGGR